MLASSQSSQKWVLYFLALGLAGLGVISVGSQQFLAKNQDDRSQAASETQTQVAGTTTTFLPNREAAIPNGLQTQPVKRLIDRSGHRRFWLTSTNQAHPAGWSLEGEVFQAPASAEQDDRLQAVSELTNGRNYIYSLDANEISALTQLGYTSTGVVFYAYTTALPNTQPIYRLVNTNTGSTFFTTNTTERDTAQKAGFRLEKTVFYLPLK